MDREEMLSAEVESLREENLTINVQPNQVKSINQRIKSYQGYIDNNHHVSPDMGTRGTSTPSCPASTSSTIRTVISKLSQFNSSVKQLMFKMPVVDVDAPAESDSTNDLININFQTQSLQRPMGDTPTEQGDEQDQDPLDRQQHTNPAGNQTPAQKGQGDGQNTTHSGQAPMSSAAGQASQSPAERAAASRHPGRAQPEDQFPVPPARTGTPQATPSVPATGPSPPVPVTEQQLAEAIRVAMQPRVK